MHCFHDTNSPPRHIYSLSHSLSLMGQVPIDTYHRQRSYSLIVSCIQDDDSLCQRSATYLNHAHTDSTISIERLPRHAHAIDPNGEERSPEALEYESHAQRRRGRRH